MKRAVAWPRARRGWLALGLCLVSGLGLLGACALPPHPSPGATAPAAEAAPRPLYDDPHQHGAADAALVFNEGLARWELFYTGRRALMRLADPRDVRWVHGTRIGIAAPAQGDPHRWAKVGEADFPAACAGEVVPGGEPTTTHWAPEIVRHAGRYHLFLTVVPGVHARWTGARHIEHLSSSDLRQWRCEGRLALGSERVIDAAVVPLDEGRWRLWFKDEADGSRLKFADSPDLRQWTVRGAVTATAAEGAKVFRFAGRWWLVADQWRGLLVMRSNDAEHWEAQPSHLLAEAGQHASDRAKGQHPDVVVVDGRAFLFYFVHQGGEPAAALDDRHHQRSVIQVAELRLGSDGWLQVDRNAPPPDLRPVFRSPGR